MQIVEYCSDQLEHLVNIYNEFTRLVPHCYPVEGKELARAFGGECGVESDGERLDCETVYVALESELLGFVHVGQRHVNKEERGKCLGIIRFLCYPRGRRDAGQALLDRAEQWLRERQIPSVVVFPQTFRYPFYGFAHTYVSDRLDHLQALLLFNGYVRKEGEIILDWPDLNPASPPPLADLSVDVEIQKKPGKGRLPNVTLKARLDEQVIGECVHLSGGTFSQCREAEQWAFCYWLGVSEAYQGKGLGRYLLRRALIEVLDTGYLHASISTAWNNHRAFLFYSNHGYVTVDWTREFERDI